MFDVSDRLRQRGWLVPAYAFPENREDLSVLRIVVRAGMTRDMADHLLEYLREQTEFLESLDAPLPDQEDAICKRTGRLPTTSARLTLTTCPAYRTSASRRAAAVIWRGVLASSTAWRSRTRTPNESSSRVPTIA